MERWRARSLPPRSALSKPDPSEDPRSAGYWRKRLGRKVSLRFMLHDDPSHQFSEAIGMVASVEGDDDWAAQVQVINRRGEVTRFSSADVVATKDF